MMLSTKETQMPLPWVAAWGHRTPNRSLTVGRTKHCRGLGVIQFPGPETSQRTGPLC